MRYLNEQTGSQFVETRAMLDLVAHRLHETHNDVGGVKKMIARQALAWNGDAKMRPYLRPTTLFDERKFPDYYGQREQPVPARDPVERRRQLEGWITKSPANRESTYYREDAPEEQKTKLKAWRKELAELKT